MDNTTPLLYHLLLCSSQCIWCWPVVGHHTQSPVSLKLQVPFSYSLLKASGLHSFEGMMSLSCFPLPWGVGCIGFCGLVLEPINLDTSCKGIIQSYLFKHHVEGRASLSAWDSVSLVLPWKLGNDALFLAASQLNWNTRLIEKHIKGGNYMVLSNEAEKRFYTI